MHVLKLLMTRPAVGSGLGWVGGGQPNPGLSWANPDPIFDTKYSILCTKNSILPTITIFPTIAPYQSSLSNSLPKLRIMTLYQTSYQTPYRAYLYILYASYMLISSIESTLHGSIPNSLPNSLSCCFSSNWPVQRCVVLFILRMFNHGIQ